MSEEILGAWIKNGKRESGSWAEVFGQENMLADEMFMAWHYARFVDSLAAAGKAAHNIPMFVNAWVIFPENPKLVAVSERRAEQQNARRLANGG